jgi:hypothetical protein
MLLLRLLLNGDRQRVALAQTLKHRVGWFTFCCRLW